MRQTDNMAHIVSASMSMPWVIARYMMIPSVINIRMQMTDLYHIEILLRVDFTLSIIEPITAFFL